MTFIYEGLSDLANIVACPVPAISPDVSLKINKYINIKNAKKSDKINYDALSKILEE